ncbi:MAG: hypothetical protein AB9917_19675 [Negativicutes bacterium]
MEKEQAVPERQKLPDEVVAVIAVAVCACLPEKSVQNKMTDAAGPPPWRLAGMIAASRLPARKRN